MKKQIVIWSVIGILSTAAFAQQQMPAFPTMTGQGVPGAMIPPNQPVAMNAGAYQSPYQGTGEIPTWANQRGQPCNLGRYENSNQFSFGPGQAAPGMPGSH